MTTKINSKLKIKYNRVSTLSQSGDRFGLDNDKYDLTLFDKISGTIPFKERPQAKKLIDLVENGQVEQLVCEDFSRIGRNVADTINVVTWLEEHKVNVVIRNIGLQSRPNGKKNPIWKMISSVLSSLYDMSRENLLERTAMGRMVYVQRGGKLGRPANTVESDKKFLDKPKTREIIKWLNKDRTIREISSHTNASNKTIIKARKMAEKYGLIKE